MIHFKNHKRGFTLVETLLSMMIVGIVLTPLFILHGVIMQRVNKSSKQLYSLLWGKQLLCEARQKQDPDAQEFTLDKKIEESGAQVKYVLDKGVDPKSSLGSYVGLHREIVLIMWTDYQGVQHREELVTYVYKQPEQKKS
jgi:prepilin-type N-terminal cleavage/methylation domain-containing protein